jgi:POT family proton-dependent oligopeptide transporter
MNNDVAQASPDAGPTKQPPGLFLLFGVEMWERFSFYGMRAFLTLFLISKAGGFGWSKEQASHLYGWYQGLVYLTPLLGGYLADRLIGTHRSIIIGGIIIASGHFCLAVPAQPTFFLGLALIILGTGFFKSNISTMVGQLYTEKDRRRDAAFTIFYMGINLGASMGQIVCPKLADAFNWHIGFSAAGFGMVLGLVVYLIFKRRFLGTIGDVPPGRASRKEKIPGVAKQPLTALEKKGVAAIAILAFFNIFFWMAFEQAGSSMTFFAEERTRRMFLGLNFLAPYFQSVNSFSVILLAPVFAWMWTRLETRGWAPSTPVRFALGLFLLGSGFVVLVVGARSVRRWRSRQSHVADRDLRAAHLWRAVPVAGGPVHGHQARARALRILGHGRLVLLVLHLGSAGGLHRRRGREGRKGPGLSPARRAGRLLPDVRGVDLRRGSRAANALAPRKTSHGREGVIGIASHHGFHPACRFAGDAHRKRGREDPRRRSARSLSLAGERRVGRGQGLDRRAESTHARAPGCGAGPKVAGRAPVAVARNRRWARRWCAARARAFGFSTPGARASRTNRCSTCGKAKAARIACSST